MNLSPLYLKIAEQLEHDIRKGNFPAGSLLPTEKELCQTHTISRYTARAALRELQDRGIISRRQGSGSTVQALQPSIKYNQFTESIGDLIAYGNSTRFKILKSKHILTDKYLSTLLDCPINTDCVTLHGLRFEPNNSKAFCISDIYRLPQQDDLDPLYENTKQALPALMKEISRENIGRVEQNITAVALDESQAQELDLTEHSPALKMVRRYFSNSGGLQITSVSTHPGHYFTYTTTLSKEY